MITREEIANFVKDLPNDGTGLPLLMERIREKDPVLYEAMKKEMDARLKEIQAMPKGNV
jgi:hypothetical protein